MMRAFLFVAATTGMIACATYPVGSGPVVGGAPSYALGELGPADLGALGTRVHALRVEPAELRLRVGQRFSLGALRVDALDVRGRLLGRLRVFDHGTSGADVVALPGPGELRAMKEGTDTLRVSFPAHLWRGEDLARPGTYVIVHVSR